MGIAMCGEMCTKFYNSWAFSSSFVGGSTFHGRWNQLFRRLEKHPNAFECDESSYDATLQPVFIETLRDIMWEFVTPRHRSKEHHTIWKNLFAEIMRGVVLCPNGDLFFKFKGNPSGSFLTIVTNTIILYMLFCYAWLCLAPEGMDTFEAFQMNVELALCGDDNLYTVSDAAVGWFNLKAVIIVWQELGVIAKYEATGEGKLLERSFLSQRTVEKFGMYMPYPDYDKVVSSLLYHTNAHHHIRWSYLKAAALRISSFWNEHLNKVLYEYIAWLGRNYSDQLRSAKDKRNQMDIFTWEQVNSVYKSDRAIVKLYTMDESKLKGNIVSSDALLKEHLPRLANR